uniref:Uncharacterized protein n=1 Tax=Ananas comosus var. bracteatus TaxID=296719 RepID=A0A6V7PPT1_ANACO|nr:unnamed protein product [Ananas comosus var. bracteatus]
MRNADFTLSTGTPLPEYRYPVQQVGVGGGFMNRPRVVLVYFGKAKDVKITKSALKTSPREQIVQNLHWSKIALGDRSLAGRDRFHPLMVAGFLMQPVPSREGPVPEREPNEKARNLAKS